MSESSDTERSVKHLGARAQDKATAAKAKAEQGASKVAERARSTSAHVADQAGHLVQKTRTTATNVDKSGKRRAAALTAVAVGAGAAVTVWIKRRESRGLAGELRGRLPRRGAGLSRRAG